MESRKCWTAEEHQRMINTSRLEADGLYQLKILSCSPLDFESTGDCSDRRRMVFLIKWTRRVCIQPSRNRTSSQTLFPQSRHTSGQDVSEGFTYGHDVLLRQLFQLFSCTRTSFFLFTLYTHKSK